WLLLFILSSVIRRCPPHSTFFPYTTLFRSLVYSYSAQVWAQDAATPPGQTNAPAPANLPPAPASRQQQFVLRDYSKPRRAFPNRSEEHTSELQSLTNLVCRLLLEKKKTNSS